VVLALDDEPAFEILPDSPLLCQSDSRAAAYGCMK
jgi:hypothetical protein